MKKYPVNVETPKEKHHLSPVQLLCLAGRLQDFAEKAGVKWETVSQAIIKMVKEKDSTGAVDLNDVHEAGYKIILDAKTVTVLG